jgi:methyl-accepting chemotaxis protein
MKAPIFLAVTVCLCLAGTLFPAGAVSDEAYITSAGAETGFTVDGMLALHAVTAYLDEQIKGVEAVLQTVAVSREARSGKWERICTLLMEAQKQIAPSVLWFSLTDGSYYTVDKGLVDKNIKDRPYFAEVLGGDVSVGTLLVSRSTSENVTVVAVPIKEKGKVTGILGASIYLGPFNEKILQKLDLPENTIFYVLDDKGITALHFRPEFIFKDPTELDSPSLANAIKEVLANREGVLRYEFEGEPREVIYTVSSYTGWHVLLGRVSEQ